ncbi:uncharacterized protein I303_100528 [Kwoniella dejecticola CBS 10117]|uniref:Ricin B lectin domain-containing protein n=1 Tax=Kwoniella dejecticola CBS 10117 TaxID=1296121 RepID=A0A1A6AF60_9TREE|nr:uncharacterized protein I303_00529 [Kwoniella dejecticola CBS 10117]OBR88712.1 hypothetical protein I303_00529 [Kwoniella dejecticola CBS 10117]
MSYLAALLPLLALTNVGLAKPLPQDTGSDYPPSSSTSTGVTNTLANSGVDSFPPSSSLSLLSSGSSSLAESSSTNTASTTVSNESASGTADTTTEAASSTSPSEVVAVAQPTQTDIYSHEPLIGVQIQSGRDAKCLSPDPREPLRTGLQVDLYPCVDATNSSNNARAWDVTPGEGALILSGTNFALNANKTQTEDPDALTLQESCGCEDLTPWYTTNDARISISGAGVCLTEDKDTDGSGPDQDLGIILFDCSDENTDQMWFTINKDNQDLVPVAPPNDEYNSQRESIISGQRASASQTASTGPSEIVAAETTTATGSDATTSTTDGSAGSTAATGTDASTSSTASTATDISSSSTAPASTMAETSSSVASAEGQSGYNTGTTTSASASASAESTQSEVASSTASDGASSTTAEVSSAYPSTIGGGENGA